MLAMCLKCVSTSKHQNQRGFTLISAIFLLVILAALGVFMLSLSTMQQTTSSQDLQGSQAYQAAKAGVEWGAYQILTPENTYPLGSVAQYACAPAPTTLPVLGGSLTKFRVSVLCTSAVFREASRYVTVYQLTSTASFGTAPDSTYIERKLTATINTCRLTVNGLPC